MASNLFNIPSTAEYPFSGLFQYGIVVSEWNEPITSALYKGALDTLLAKGIPAENIHTIKVPGSFELPYGAKYLLCKKGLDAVICLGCVIQGETRHFDFICSAVANELMKLSTDFIKPVIFGVLTTNTLEQAQERSGGRYGNKGVEAALAALSLMSMSHSS